MLRELYKIASVPVAPFHDDWRLQALIGRIIRHFEIKTFFETGTFRGDTVKWVAERFPDVECVSVEDNPTFYHHALKKTAGLANVKLLHMDSRQALKFNLGVYYPMLFWLDAHWDEDWPLLSELKLITEGEFTKIPCVIIVDDFKVPRRPSLGFDSYNGVELSYDYIKGQCPLRVFVPDYDERSRPVALEKKEYRGYAVIYQGLEPLTNVWVSPLEP
jgi:hypothetical protein